MRPGYSCRVQLVRQMAVWLGALRAHRAPEGKVLEKDDRVYFWNSCW